MSLFGKKARIDGLNFAVVLRGPANGTYTIVFEREFATLEQIEAVNWAKPTIEGDTILPKEYGYEVKGITYSSSDSSYRVSVRVAQQYLGDVTEYQERINELREERQALSAQNEAKQAEIDSLERYLAEADEALIAMYEQQTVPVENTVETRKEAAE